MHVNSSSLKFRGQEDCQFGNGTSVNSCVRSDSGHTNKIVLSGMYTNDPNQWPLSGDRRVFSKYNQFSNANIASGMAPLGVSIKVNDIFGGPALPKVSGQSLAELPALKQSEFGYMTVESGRAMSGFPIRK